MSEWIETSQETDIERLKNFLPAHYSVEPSKKKGAIHCKSRIGIENDGLWQVTFNMIKNHFGSRFSEVFHNVCTNHVDFTIHLN